MKAEEIPTLKARIRYAESILHDLGEVVPFIELVRDAETTIHIQPLDEANVSLTARAPNGDTFEISLPAGDLRLQISSYLQAYRESLSFKLDQA